MASPKRRPISRKFWYFLKYFPSFIRAPFLRSQFRVPLQLPDDIILKQAETEDEITQALRMVYDSYVDLNYIDPNDSRLRVTKYHLLPTTVILIAARRGEVLGTLSIIIDSPFKLPSDLTWDLSKYRKNGCQIAEISSLTIGKKTERRGQLLLPMCKLMYLYCKNLLKLDGIVVSTTLEVENFYTDLLLFEKATPETGQANQLVKGNPSTCCFLPLNDTVSENNYQKVYLRKKDEFNLFKYFVQTETPNIKLPSLNECLQSYTVKQTMSYSKILEQYPQLTANLNLSDKKIIRNLDPSNILNLHRGQDGQNERRMRLPRYEIRRKSRCYFSCTNTIAECILLNVSESGFKIAFTQETAIAKNQKTILIFFSIHNQTYEFEGTVKWNENDNALGCIVEKKNEEWLKFYLDIQNEFQKQAS